MMTPEDLVVGPRGRAALLAFAQASEGAVLGYDGERPLGWAVHEASFRLAKEHGHSVTFFGWGEERTRPANTASDVASRLGDVPLGPVAPDVLVEALSASVDSAMYWQEPDGDDLLCAIPEVRTALLRVAEHLVASPAVQAWAAPVDLADQWQVVWDDDEPPQRPDLATWRQTVLAQESEAQRTRPADPRANVSGMWWSRPPLGLAASTGSFGEAGPYGLWLVEDSLGWKAATVHDLQPDASSRVFEIGDAAAWAELCREFPLEVTASRRHDWYRTTGRAGRWVIPDWSLVARHYDAVHLSIAGYLAAATTAIEVGDTASVIAGCGPDTTWWLNDTARRVGEPVRWQATEAEPGPPWAPTP